MDVVHKCAHEVEVQECEQFLVGGKRGAEEGGERGGFQQGAFLMQAQVQADPAPFCGPLNWKERGVQGAHLFEYLLFYGWAFRCGKLFLLEFSSSSCLLACFHEKGGRRTSSSLIQAILKFSPERGACFASPIFIPVSDLQSLGHRKDLNERVDQRAGFLSRY